MKPKLKRLPALNRLLALACCAALVVAFTTSCALYRKDRCWVPPEQYSLARDLFIQTGSFDLVKRNLAALKWETCKVNEVFYRLQKEFEVLPEELPQTFTEPSSETPPSG